MPPSPIAAPSRTRVVRVIVQAVFVAIIAYLGVRHQLVGGRGGAAPLDSFCPFGAIEALPALLGGFGMLPKTGTSNFVLLGAVGIVTLGLSASFCGWLCPFGAVQDWLSLAGKRVFGRQLKVPEKVHAYLRHVRWAVLALIVYMSWTTLGLWFADYDPFRALFHFKFESWIAFLLVGLTLVLGLAIERFWCLYACPLGAVVGFFGRL
ncbi:MAG: 4Fe-4S binding protein, partial [Coriobacteriia bacterium]|nr:4Fe-4S binding protein [Coriobacteriia bacterium]